MEQSKLKTSTDTNPSKRRVASAKNPKITFEYPPFNYLYSKRYTELAEENKKRPGYLIKKKKEDKRQEYIKKMNLVTNQINNYFYPKCHKRSWWPNGLYIVKHRYNYTKHGLEHIYEKNNVEELKPIEPLILNNKKKDYEYINKFIEYENINPGNFLITIEYCSSCEEHFHITQHNSDNIFKDLAFKYQKIIMERFPFIKVVLKPTDVDIVKSKVKKMKNPQRNGEPHRAFSYLNEQFKPCRIGAFEIQIATKNEKNEVLTRLIHSKLKTKKFPKVKQVLGKIVSMMPLFNLNLTLYDKDDYQDLNKMNDIEVSIYLSNSEIVQNLGDSINENINNFVSPGKKLELIKTQRFMKKNALFKNIQNNIMISNNNTFNGKRTITSAFRASRNKFIITNNKANNDINNNKNIEQSNENNNENNNENDNDNDNENCDESDESYNAEIENYNILKKQKGILLKRFFSKVENNSNNVEFSESSESVDINFGLLPYDTYIIETKENSNFEGSLTLLKFTEINFTKNIYKQIGLSHQKKAILNVYLYKEVINDKNEIDQIPIENGTITISKVNDPNSRYQLYNNKTGLYEHKTKPGDYKLETYAKDFERDVRKINLESALNTLNIKLNPNNNCELLVEVLEYDENYEDLNNENDSHIELIPVRNVQVQIYKNCDDLINEGLTNSNGLMEYFIDKNDDNLSIKVSKKGYYKVERFFKKFSAMSKNKNNNYYMTMTFILINKKKLLDLQKTIFVSYANISKRLFDFYFDSYDSKNNIDIKDLQKEKGVFIASFWRDNDDLDALTQNQENEFSQQNNNNNNEDQNTENNNNNTENNNENNNNIENSKITRNSGNSEECNFEEIIRFGAKISGNILNKKGYEETGTDDVNESIDNNINDRDIIDYLINVCLEGNIYTPENDFYINLPKALNKNSQSESSSNNNENTNTNNNNENQNISNSNNNNNIFNNNGNNGNNENNGNSENDENNIQKTSSSLNNDIYWDLGWIDLKNHYYYETSVYFEGDNIPDRISFYEILIEFFQGLIDKQLYNSLFEYFHFNMSTLARGDRYLEKQIFEKQAAELLESITQNEEVVEGINFICNILCGYDEENNIRDDRISFNLLKKKVSSLMKNLPQN